MLNRTQPVAIAGAGIAGLTAALALARRGIASDIVEQAETISEVGAGLQISPNASRILDRLGALPALEAIWTEPDGIALLSGLTLKSIASVPAGRFARSRWGAPYGVLMRATLQQALLAQVLANPLCRVHTGHRLATGTASDFEAVTGRRPALIVGADGVRSAIRTQIGGAQAPRFTGTVAHRFLLPQAEWSHLFNVSHVSAYLGPGAHLVVYPIRENSCFNLVAITHGLAETDEPAARAAALQAVRRWHPDLQAAMAAGSGASRWPLFEVRHGPWHDESDTILIGDAAHAMLPHAAQGAAMAIEDAFELASFVDSEAGLADAIEAFAAHRAKRVEKVRARGAFNRFAYHARGPFRIGRDIVLSLRKGETLARDLDWIYGYQARD